MRKNGQRRYQAWAKGADADRNKDPSEILEAADGVRLMSGDACSYSRSSARAPTKYRKTA
jgi:hypothetical protein